MDGWIKRGDQYEKPISISYTDKEFDIDEIASVQFYLGGIVKYYPEDVRYDTTEKAFMFPLTQEESFKFQASGCGYIDLDIRIKDNGNQIFGLEYPIKIKLSNTKTDEEF